MTFFRILKIIAKIFLSVIVSICDVIKNVIVKENDYQSLERIKERKSVAFESDEAESLLKTDKIYECNLKHPTEKISDGLPKTRKTNIPEEDPKQNVSNVYSLKDVRDNFEKNNSLIIEHETDQKNETPTKEKSVEQQCQKNLSQSSLPESSLNVLPQACSTPKARKYIPEAGRNFEDRENALKQSENEPTMSFQSISSEVNKSLEAIHGNDKNTSYPDTISTTDFLDISKEEKYCNLCKKLRMKSPIKEGEETDHKTFEESTPTEDDSNLNFDSTGNANDDSSKENCRGNFCICGLQSENEIKDKANFVIFDIVASYLDSVSKNELLPHNEENLVSLDKNSHGELPNISFDGQTDVKSDQNTKGKEMPKREDRAPSQPLSKRAKKKLKKELEAFRALTIDGTLPNNPKNESFCLKKNSEHYEEKLKTPPIDDLNEKKKEIPFKERVDIKYELEESFKPEERIKVENIKDILRDITSIAAKYTSGYGEIEEKTVCLSEDEKDKNFEEKSDENYRPLYIEELIDLELDSLKMKNISNSLQYTTDELVSTLPLDTYQNSSKTVDIKKDEITRTAATSTKREENETGEVGKLKRKTTQNSSALPAFTEKVERSDKIKTAASRIIELVGEILVSGHPPRNVIPSSSVPQSQTTKNSLEASLNEYNSYLNEYKSIDKLYEQHSLEPYERGASKKSYEIVEKSTKLQDASAGFSGATNSLARVDQRENDLSVLSGSAKNKKIDIMNIEMDEFSKLTTERKKKKPKKRKRKTKKSKTSKNDPKQEIGSPDQVSEHEDVECSTTVNQSLIINTSMDETTDNSKIEIEGVDDISIGNSSIDELMVRNSSGPILNHSNNENYELEDLSNQETIKDLIEEELPMTEYLTKQENPSARESAIVDENKHSLSSDKLPDNDNDVKLAFKEIEIESKNIVNAEEIEYEKPENNFTTVNQVTLLQVSKSSVEETAIGCDEEEFLEKKAELQENLTPIPIIEEAFANEATKYQCSKVTLLKDERESQISPENTEQLKESLEAAEEKLNGELIDSLKEKPGEKVSRKKFKNNLNTPSKTSKDLSSTHDHGMKERIESTDKHESQKSPENIEKLKESFKAAENKINEELIETLNEKTGEKVSRKKIKNNLNTPTKISRDLSYKHDLDMKERIESKVHQDKEFRENQSISDKISSKSLSASPDIPPPFTLKKIILTGDSNNQLPSISGKAPIIDSNKVIKMSSTDFTAEENSDSKNKTHETALAVQKPENSGSDPIIPDLVYRSISACSEDSDEVSDFGNRTLIVFNSSFKTSSDLNSEFSSCKSQREDWFREVMSSDESDDYSIPRPRTPKLESSYQTKENLSKIQTFINQIQNPLSSPTDNFLNSPFQFSNQHFLYPVWPGIYYPLNFDANALKKIIFEEKEDLETRLYINIPKKLFDLRLNCLTVPHSESNFTDKESTLQTDLGRERSEKLYTNQIDQHSSCIHLNALNIRNSSPLEQCNNCMKLNINNPAFDNNNQTSSTFTPKDGLNIEGDTTMHEIQGIEDETDDNLLITPFRPLYRQKSSFYEQNDDYAHIQFKPDVLINYQALVPIEKLHPGVHFCSEEFENSLGTVLRNDSEKERIDEKDLNSKDFPSLTGKKTSEELNMSFQEILSAERVREKQLDTKGFSLNDESQSYHNEQNCSAEHLDGESEETWIQQDLDEDQNNEKELGEELIDNDNTQEEDEGNSLDQQQCQYFSENDNAFLPKNKSHEGMFESDLMNSTVIGNHVSQTENLLFMDHPHQFLNPTIFLAELATSLPKLKRKSEIKVKTDCTIFKCFIVTRNSDSCKGFLNYPSSCSYDINLVVNDSVGNETAIKSSHMSLIKPKICLKKGNSKKPRNLEASDKERKVLKLENESEMIVSTKEVDMGFILLNKNEKIEIRGEPIDYWKYVPCTEYNFLPSRNFLHYLFKHNIPFFNCNKDVDEVLIGEAEVPCSSSVPVFKPKLTVFERQSIPTANIEIFKVLNKNTKLYFSENIDHSGKPDDILHILNLIKSGYFIPVNATWEGNPITERKIRDFVPAVENAEEGDGELADSKSSVQVKIVQAFEDKNRIPKKPNEITSVLKHAQQRGAMATIENVSKLRILAHRLRTIPRYNYDFTKTCNTGWMTLQEEEPIMQAIWDFNIGEVKRT